MVGLGPDSPKLPSDSAQPAWGYPSALPLGPLPWEYSTKSVACQPSSKTTLHLPVWTDSNLLVKASGEGISRAFHPPSGQEMFPDRPCVCQSTHRLGFQGSKSFCFCYED